MDAGRRCAGRSAIAVLAALAVVGGIASVEFVALVRHGRGPLAPPVSAPAPVPATASATVGWVDDPAGDAIAGAKIYIKGWALEWPRLENERLLMAIGSARPLEDAARIAYKELVLWMEAEYGFDRWDAYMMLSQCGLVRLGNFVDPKYTVGAGIEKKYLAP